MLNNNGKNVIYTTLAYFDIFDYPLTLIEIQKFIPQLFTSSQLKNLLVNPLIEKKEDYYFLKGRENIVAQRKKREIISERKLQKAKKIAVLLSKIPAILYIGVSGSLAMKNAKVTDDIDLFIITKKNTLWISRLIAIIFLSITGNLRRYGQKTTEDIFCINMWIDSAHLEFSIKRQNIYTAHELIQLYGLYDKSRIYSELLTKNNWIQTFFPNIKVQTYKKTVERKSLMILFEPFAKTLQLWYMKKHITTETINEGFVAFHPNDYTGKILKEWKDRLKK